MDEQETHIDSHANGATQPETPPAPDNPASENTRVGPVLFGTPKLTRQLPKLTAPLAVSASGATRRNEQRAAQQAAACILDAILARWPERLAPPAPDRPA